MRLAQEGRLFPEFRRPRQASTPAVLRTEPCDMPRPDPQSLWPHQDPDPFGRSVAALPPWPGQAGARDSIPDLLGQ